MMSSPQKAKGSSWERSVAEFLSETYGETFSRTPGSGAYVGGDNRVRKQLLSENTVRVYKGDIIPGPGFPLLNVECKSYKTFAFHQLFSQSPLRQLEQWIQQCLDAADAGDLNALFIKISRQGTYICTPVEKIYTLPVNSIQYQSTNHGLWLFSELTIFFQLNSQQFKSLATKNNQIH